MCRHRPASQPRMPARKSSNGVLSPRPGTWSASRPKSASSCARTWNPSAAVFARVGHLDLKAQAELRSAPRSDTPRSVSLCCYLESETSACRRVVGPLPLFEQLQALHERPGPRCWPGPHKWARGRPAGAGRRPPRRGGGRAGTAGTTGTPAAKQARARGNDEGRVDGQQDASRSGGLPEDAKRGAEPLRP